MSATEYAKNLPMRGNVTSGMDRISNMPRASISNIAGLSALTSGAPTVITWDTLEYDTDGMWSASTPTRLTARTAGLYSFKAWLSWASNVTDYRRIVFTKGTGEIYGENIVAAVTGAITSQCTTANIPMSAGGYVQLIATQTSGGALAIQPGSAGVGQLQWNGFQACLIST